MKQSKFIEDFGSIYANDCGDKISMTEAAARLWITLKHKNLI